MAFFYQSSTRYLSHVSAVICHILQPMSKRDRIIKMVTFGKEIENDKN